MPAYNKSLVWFRRDLRSADHAALHQALTQSGQVFCAFVFDTDILNDLPRHDRRVGFIHASLAELDAELRRLGGALIVRHGRALEEIPKLVQQLGAGAVFVNRDYEPAAIVRDTLVEKALRQLDCSMCGCKDQVVFERDEILSQSGKPFSVFTPYKNAWMKRLAADESDALRVWSVEEHASRFAPFDPALHRGIPSLADLGFLQTDLNELGIVPGMTGAERLLEDFRMRIDRYDAARDFPSVKGPSYLSVHLRFGTVSVRGMARLAREAMRSGAERGASTWLSELIWREFFFMILYHHPHVTEGAFRPTFDRIAWESGKEADEMFAAWCEGRTGYPLVDAAMTQLNRTGYMHNRLRMVSASFLVKDLGIDWRRGERYFALKLNDFDLAANNGGWQWAASTGCDAQPWFRIFNPVTQSEKFDPQGKFIRRYLPQLAGLPDKYIHAPWRAPESELEKAGVTLGSNYPAPIVDHAQARERTLARYAAVKAEA